MKAQKKLLTTAALATFGSLIAAGAALADPVSTGWYAGGATAASRSSSNTALAVGAGLSDAINPNLDATAELVRDSRVGNASATGHTGLSTVNVGLLYHFG